MEENIISRHSIPVAITRGFSKELGDLITCYENQIGEFRAELQKVNNKEVGVGSIYIEGDFLIVTYTFSELDSSNIENK